MIYFAQQTNGGPIRIGASENVGARKKALGSWICGGVEIIATAEGGYFREAVLIELFKPINVYLDWFRSCESMWRFLIDGPIGGNLSWMPEERRIGKDEIRVRVSALFPDLDEAAVVFGYPSQNHLAMAISNVGGSSVAVAAKVVACELLRAGSVPSYIAELHGTSTPSLNHTGEAA